MSKYLYFKSNINWNFKIEKSLFDKVKALIDKDNIEITPITYNEYKVSVKMCVIIRKDDDINNYWNKAYTN